MSPTAFHREFDPNGFMKRLVGMSLILLSIAITAGVGVFLWTHTECLLAPFDVCMVPRFPPEFAFRPILILAVTIPFVGGGLYLVSKPGMNGESHRPTIIN